MPTHSVVLTEDQHALVQTLVQSGRYPNASAVMRDGLRLVQQRDRTDAIKLQALQQAASQGWADVAAGRYADVAADQLAAFVGQLSHRAGLTGV